MSPSINIAQNIDTLPMTDNVNQFLLTLCNDADITHEWIATSPGQYVNRMKIV